MVNTSHKMFNITTSYYAKHTNQKPIKKARKKYLLIDDDVDND